MSQTVKTPIALPGIATEVMESLYQHRLLSTTQIHRLHTPDANRSFTRRLLAALAASGMAAYAPAAGRLKLWYLTDRGSDAVETIPTRAERRRRQVHPEQAAGPLRAHTLAVNDTGIAFVEAARAHQDDCGPLSWRHEIAHPLSPPHGRHPPEMLIADALLTYTRQHPDRTLTLHQRFIELDRATMPVHALAEKLARYTRLYHYTANPTGRGAPAPLWREHYAEFPAVLIVFAHHDRRRLERRMQHLIALHRADPHSHEPHVQLVLLEELRASGPFAAIFIDPQHPERYTDWLGNPPPER